MISVVAKCDAVLERQGRHNEGRNSNSFNNDQYTFVQQDGRSG